MEIILKKYCIFFVKSLQIQNLFVYLHTETTTQSTMKTKELAARFLEIADQMNEAVSRYIDGSNAPEDEKAYWIVREADRAFIDAIRAEYGEKYEYGLNYELAESFV